MLAQEDEQVTQTLKLHIDWLYAQLDEAKEIIRPFAHPVNIWSQHMPDGTRVEMAIYGKRLSHPFGSIPLGQFLAARDYLNKFTEGEK